MTKVLDVDVEVVVVTVVVSVVASEDDPTGLVSFENRFLPLFVRLIANRTTTAIKQRAIKRAIRIGIYFL